MTAMPLNTPARGGGLLALSLVCATALPAWSGPFMVTETESRPAWTTGQAGPPVANQLPKTAGPPPSSVPTWSAVPSAPDATPSWLRLPSGAGPSPGWSPPSPPVINNPPLWQGS